MRVRLYEVGVSAVGKIFRIDEFPAKLTLDKSGNLQIAPSDQTPTCLLEDRGGELFIHVNGVDKAVYINDAEIEYGPLNPGDHLTVGRHCYLVSYEPTACEQRSSMKVRILS